MQCTQFSVRLFLFEGRTANVVFSGVLSVNKNPFKIKTKSTVILVRDALLSLARNEMGHLWLLISSLLIKLPLSVQWLLPRVPLALGECGVTIMKGKL